MSTGTVYQSICRSIGMSALGVGLLGFSPSDAYAKASLSVMFWNVENYFDAAHDEGKDDWTFLPLGTPGKREGCGRMTTAYYREECLKTDWTVEKFAERTKQLAQSVKKITDGSLPQIFGVCEVENANTMKALASALNYPKFEITSSPDSRGIDVGLFYVPSNDLVFVGRDEHVVSGREGTSKATRNILEVKFKWNGKPLFVFVNHWPSQAAPTTARIDAAETMMRVIASRTRSNPNAQIIAMGDFNTTLEDYPSPFHSVVLKGGNKSLLVDLHEAYTSDRRVPVQEKRLMPFGTHFYPPGVTWTRLDRIFVSRNLVGLDGGGFDEEKTARPTMDYSYRIGAEPFMQKNFEYTQEQSFGLGTIVTGVPNRANFEAERAEDMGFSDHFPVLGQFN